MMHIILPRRHDNIETDQWSSCVGIKSMKMILPGDPTIHTNICFYQESIEDNNINVDLADLALTPPHLRITPDHLARSFVFP